MLPQGLRLLAWRALAVCCVALGLLGIVLPGLPTVPFLLVAAWLLTHPRHGPPIRRWRERGAVPRRAKWMASAMMLTSTAVLAGSNLPLAAKLAVPALMLVVAVWLWRRPED